MIKTLFGETEHDPGGKVRTALPAGVTGDAWFSECKQYRFALTRRWSAAPGFVLWIGMNPSTATAEVDDPTMTRVRGFTDRLGYSGYVMTNVMDYRATNPKDLLCVAPCSAMNLPTIMDYATTAGIVIAAWGAVDRRLRCYATRVEDMLNLAGVDIFCLGTTKDGSPRHPLYLKGDTPLVMYLGKDEK